MEDDWPDIQLFFASSGDNADGGIFGRRNNGITDDYYATVFEPILYKDSVTIIPLLLRPRSRGYILLKDKDPMSHPLIHPHYFSDPQDLEVMVCQHFNLIEIKYLRRHWQYLSQSEQIV